MAVLHVRNVPEDLYQRMQALAAERHMSLSALVVELMERESAEAAQRRRHARAVRAVRAAADKRPALPQGLTAADVIRDGRDQRLSQLAGTSAD